MVQHNKVPAYVIPLAGEGHKRTTTHSDQGHRQEQENDGDQPGSGLSPDPSTAT